MTSQAAHTPGRLKTDFDFLLDENGHVFGATQSNDPALCRRLAAAWNAAHDAGLSTEALEAGVVEQMVALQKLEDASPGLRTTLVKIRAVLAMIGEGR